MPRNVAWSLFALLLAVALSPTGGRAEETCGCGGERTTCATCRTGHHHFCRRCVICVHGDEVSGRSAKSTKSSKKSASASDYRSATVVSSMPMFMPIMPVMMAAPSVVQTGGSRAAESSDSRAAGVDCHERIGKLEKDVQSLAEAVQKLQIVVEKQTGLLGAISERLDSNQDKPKKND